MKQKSSSWNKKLKKFYKKNILLDNDTIAKMFIFEHRKELSK